MDYVAVIVPIIQDLCKMDGGNSESNFGQMSELVKRVAQLEQIKPGTVDKIREYAENVEPMKERN